MTAVKQILVVDDDRITLGLMRDLLEDVGYSVACAANGREALDHLERAEPPFAILLDLSMPVVSGWAFREQQQRMPALANIPVLLLSGEQDLAQIAASLGVAGHFRKPVEPADLLLAVKSIRGQGPAESACVA